MSVEQQLAAHIAAFPETLPAPFLQPWSLVGVGSDEFDVVRNATSIGAAPTCRLPMCVVPTLPEAPEDELCSLESEVDHELALQQPSVPFVYWPRVLDVGSLVDVEVSRPTTRFDVVGEQVRQYEVDISKNARNSTSLQRAPATEDFVRGSRKKYVVRSSCLRVNVSPVLRQTVCRFYQAVFIPRPKQQHRARVMQICCRLALR